MQPRTLASDNSELLSANMLILRFACLVTLFSLVRSDFEPPWYKVDLDQPAEARWNHVAQEYKTVVNDLDKALSQYIPKAIRPLVIKLAGDVNNYIEEPFASEMRGLAKSFGMSLGDMVIANILYDITAFCTSIVAQDSAGQIWLARNLDYTFTHLLQNATIGVHFVRNGTVLYSGTTFAGYIGLLTGQRPDSFSISLDERDEGGLLLNILMALLNKKTKLISFLIRQTLEEESSFELAVQRLSSTATLATAYLTVAGVQRGEGALITKMRLPILRSDIWYLDPPNERWYLVETNYDHWKPPPTSDDRRTPAERSLNATGPDNISVETLYHILSTPPVLASITAYTTVMSAKDHTYKNWVRTGNSEP